MRKNRVPRTKLDIADSGAPMEPAHPSIVSWRTGYRDIKESVSKDCGGKTLWSTTKTGGYITWNQLVNFIGEPRWNTLRVRGQES